MKSLSITPQAHTSTLLRGQLGCGQTSAVKQKAEALQVPPEIVLASPRESSGCAGLPIVQGSNARLTLPSWARRLVEAGPGMLFPDGGAVLPTYRPSRTCYAQVLTTAEGKEALKWLS